MDCFSSSTSELATFAILNDAKFRSNNLRVSTQNITRALRTNVNFLKSCSRESCQLLFAWFRNFSQESNAE